MVAQFDEIHWLIRCSHPLVKGFFRRVLRLDLQECLKTVLNPRRLGLTPYISPCYANSKAASYCQKAPNKAFQFFSEGVVFATISIS